MIYKPVKDGHQWCMSKIHISDRDIDKLDVPLGNKSDDTEMSLRLETVRERYQHCIP